jgi:Asp-tRNA(Asn)/Glu-tRNA(Gln) amidotransferase A subunit family amidase
MLAELAAAVRERRVSSEELVRRSLERIERLDEPIHAVVALRADEALDEARALDARTAAGADPRRPLAGLPLLVKDGEDVAGMRTTYGSLLFADAPPASADGLAVARLRSAGAIVVGKSNLPELAFEGYTDNRLFGPTRNPWAPEWSPGGSSGGSGAALAMGLAPLATATDGGGSIRIPATFCGLVGLKPTNGLIARGPLPSWIDLSTSGPLATCVADARLLLDVLRGPAPGDPTALPSWTPRPGVAPTRLLAAPRFVDYGPLPEGVAAAFEAALARLSEVLGLPVEPRGAAPVGATSDDDWFLQCAVEELVWLGRERVEREAERLTHVAATIFRIATDATIDDYVAARRRRFAYARALDELVAGDALLATPTMCVEGIPADGRMPGAERPGTGADVYNTQTQNLTGHPAISLPAGVCPNGVPFGLQLTGPRFADDVLLVAAERWEAAEPWPRVAPGFAPFDA